MPKYQVITTFNEGTDQAKGPGEIVELTEEQAGPFVKTKRLALYTKPGAFAQEVEKHKLLPDELPGLTVKQLTALPDWDLVPEPKPTKKTDIIAAIRAARGE